jgi:hypothetical protein
MNNHTTALATTLDQPLGARPAPLGFNLTQDVRLKQAQAEMMARYQMALAYPRDRLAIHNELVRACSNTDFAIASVYSKPRAGGKNDEGLSIRFAEFVYSILRNVSLDIAPESETEEDIAYRMTFNDLESNSPVSEVFKISKVVERKKKPDDAEYPSRFNSKGELVYLVPATEQDLYSKYRSVASRVRRQLILQILPPDLRVQCFELCKATKLSSKSFDPDSDIKNLLTSFREIGVDPSDLKSYLGHAVPSSSPAEIDELRGIFVLIREGEATWADVMEARRAEAPAGSRADFVAKKKEERKQKAARAPRAARGAAAAATPADGAPAATEPAKPETTAPRANRRGGAAAATAPAEPAATTTPEGAPAPVSEKQE